MRTILPTTVRSWRTVHTLAVGALVLHLGACTSDSAPSPTVPPVVDPQPAETVGVASIFQRTCAFSGCHAGAAPQMGLNLSPDVFRANVVGVASRQVPELLLVQEGRPDSSYLMLKLDGQAGAVGGIGTQMPLGGELTPAQRDSVRTWIHDGAPSQ